MTRVPATNASGSALRGLGFMLAASASFAAMNALAAALSRAGTPWEHAAFARASLGLLFSLLVARARGVSLGVRDRRAMWTRSLAGSTSMLLTFYALTHMPLADATALLNTTPLWIAGLAYLTLGERPGRAVLAAIAVALAGVWFVQRPAFAQRDLTGLVALAAGASSALSMVSLRRLGGQSPEAIVVHFSAVASGFTGVAVLARAARTGAVTAPQGPAAWVMLLAVGVTATLGQLAMTRAYALDRAARVGAAGWAQVLLALALDGLLRQRWPERSSAIGITLIVLAGWILLASARREGTRGR
jgi:drug/metabolite transporter (DMT)-like permease